MSHEYPRGVYHPVFGGKTVYDEAEYAEALRTGWASTPALVREAERLRATIANLEENLAATKARLAVLEGEAPRNAMAEVPQRGPGRPRKP